MFEQPNVLFKLKRTFVVLDKKKSKRKCEEMKKTKEKKRKCASKSGGCEVKRAINAISTKFEWAIVWDP